MGAEKCKFIKNKVSVVTPVFNGESHLERMLDSILGQTYQELEMILVDDGSTDRSGEICDEYSLKDERIKVIHKGGLLGGFSEMPDKTFFRFP